MPYEGIQTFWQALEAREGVGAAALRLTVLTGARTTEVIHAKWDEFDFDKGVWTIPAERMKAGFGHRVPLSSAAVTVLESLPRIDGWVFPGARGNQPISNMAMLKVLKKGMGHKNLTVHGFRSTFRDWIAEQTNYPNIVAEKALAHSMGDRTEAAYRRGDMLERRRPLMNDWASVVTGAKKLGGEVVVLSQVSTAQ